MKPFRHLLAGAALVCATQFAPFAVPAAQAAAFAVDVSGVQSVNLAGEDGNAVLWIDIGAFSLLEGVSWAVTLDAVSPSTRAEMQVGFGASDGADMLAFAPAGDDAAAGSGSYAGALDLRGLGVAAGADGRLRIEFSESYKDFATGTVEGTWTAGSLVLEVSPVPEPAAAALALLGLTVVGAQARRRRPVH